MRMSSSLVAPSAVAILSTALLCGLSGTAMSQTTTAPPFPASRSTRRANGEAATEAGGDGKIRSGAPERAGHRDRSNGDWDAVGCAGSCHGEACPARERGQQLQRWLRIKLPTRQGPLGWMQRIGGVLLSFLSNVQRHTHPQGLRAMRGNQNVPGLGPTTILVVLHRHAGWGEISGHRRKSKQVAHVYRARSGQRRTALIDLGERVMRMSSSLVAPSAVAVLSTVLLSGTAAAQTATGSATQLPSITVEAPKQVARPVARPQRQAPPVANTVAARPTSPAPQTPPTSAQKPASGSVMARIAALEKTSSNCTDGCQTSFKYGNQPWNGCSTSSGDFIFRQRAETYATTKPTRSAGKPECFWPGDTVRVWWYCSSLHAGGKLAGEKLQVAELKRSGRR